jgi:outer membrane lipoprotein-sorting protein
MSPYGQARPAPAHHALRRVLPLLCCCVLGDLTVFAQEEKPAGEDRLPTGERIMDKTLLARGGKEAFEKLENRVQKGTIEIAAGPQKAKGKITTHAAAPDKFYQFRDLGTAGKIEIGTDGETYWNIIGAKATVKEGNDREDMVASMDFYKEINWRDHFETVECLGKETIDGRSCYKVSLTSKTGDVETRYFDRKTGLHVRTEETSQGAQGEVKNETRYEDYREVNGVRFPFKIIQTSTGGGQSQTVTTVWESIEANAEIPDKQFDLPAAVKTAAKKASKPAPDKKK